MTDLHEVFEATRDRERHDLEKDLSKALDDLRKTREELERFKANNKCPSCGLQFQMATIT